MGNIYSNNIEEYNTKLNYLEKNLSDLNDDYKRQATDYEKLIQEYEEVLNENDELNTRITVTSDFVR